MLELQVATGTGIVGSFITTQIIGELYNLNLNAIQTIGLTLGVFIAGVALFILYLSVPTLQSVGEKYAISKHVNWMLKIPGKKLQQGMARNSQTPEHILRYIAHNPKINDYRTQKYITEHKPAAVTRSINTHLCDTCQPVAHNYHSATPDVWYPEVKQHTLHKTHCSTCTSTT